MTDEELIYKIATDKEVSIEEATLVLHRSRAWALAAIAGSSERAEALWQATAADLAALRRKRRVFERYRRTEEEDEDEGD